MVSGDDHKLECAKALGAAHGINRKKEDWVQAVYRLTGDRGADHILEIVDGAHLEQSLKAAAVFGRIALIGVLDGFEIAGHFAPLTKYSSKVTSASAIAEPASSPTVTGWCAST